MYRTKIFTYFQVLLHICGTSRDYTNILPISVIADDWNYFSKSGLKIAYTNPMIVRENFNELSSYAGHVNISQVAYKDDRIWFMFFVNFRKHLYGLIRKVLLYISSKAKY